MKRIILYSFLAALLLSSCEYMSYEEFSIKPYDGALTFTEVTKKAEWSNRFDHATVAYDNKLWVLGGYNPGQVVGDTYYEDVWYSSDGKLWELATDSAAWKGRRGHAVVAFDDGSGEAMYLLGGFSVDENTGYRQYCNDVWKSTDGIEWTQIKERSYPDLDSSDTWFPRMNHAVVVANHNGTNYMYIIGGRTQLENHKGTYAQEYFSDVWRSSDGANWEKLDNNDYGMRASFAAAVDPNTGIIYIQGGAHGLIFDAPGNASEPSEDYYYLWSSPDGVNWTTSYDSTFDNSYLRRVEHSMAFYDNKLWIFPGSTTSTMHYQFTSEALYGTWCVDDGLWKIDSKGSDLHGRHSYGIAEMNDKIWFTGGFTSNKGQNNVVWSADIN